MKLSITLSVAMVLFLAHAQAAPPAVRDPTATAPITQIKEHPMKKHAKGSFDVKIVPLAVNENSEGDMRGRMSINKQFHGDLEATSIGEMLTAMTVVQGSAGYVAIERVTGNLQGRKGSFTLQHSGTMNRGQPTLTVSIVPDSGSDELIGISGELRIIIAEGKHSYELDYTIAADS